MATTPTTAVAAPRRRRRVTDYAFWLLGALVVAALVTAVAFLSSGGRTLIVRSGSMVGTFNAGDIAVTRTGHPTEVEVGDIVTFSDPSRNGDLVTHRVVQMKREGDTFFFQTKGDANTGAENWSINARGTLGRYQFRVPYLGYALAWASSAVVRTALLLLGGAVFLITTLRRIWSS